MKEGLRNPIQDDDIVIDCLRGTYPQTIYDKIANAGIQRGKIVVITTDKIKGKHESYNRAYSTCLKGKRWSSPVLYQDFN